MYVEIPIHSWWSVSDIFIAHQLNWYRFIGRVLGKALYEDILVDVAFAGFFLAKVRLALMSFILIY
jgi:hypothetical protein